MNSLDVARNKIKDLVPETAAKMQISTQNAETIIDQIIFELLKEVVVYEYKETKKDEKKSLNQISGIGNEADLKRHSRKMQYSNYYRKELSERMKREYDFSSPELDIKDMSALGKRHPGYQLSRYDIEQLEAMENLVLLNNIVNRRITVQKKISKAELIDEYNEYQDYFKTKFNPRWRTINGMTVDQMCSPTLTDTDFVLYNILLFTTELKYHITSFYLLADKISKYQDSKSAYIFPENYVTLISCFNRSLEFDYAMGNFVKENSLLFIRHSIIEEMEPGNVTACVEKYNNNMKLCAVVKDLVKSQNAVMEVIKGSSNQERREFIENHYPVYRVIYTPLEWDNKKVRCLRELYADFIRPIAPPKIG